MKKLIALSFAACVFSFAASAQTDRTQAKTERQGDRRGKHGKGEMMKDLNLTDAQKAQLKTQHQEMKAKRQALKAQDNITVKEMREKQAALKAEQKSRFEAILTAEQRAKFAEKKAKMDSRMKDKKGKGNRKDLKA